MSWAVVAVGAWIVFALGVLAGAAWAGRKVGTDVAREILDYDDRPQG